MEDFVDSLTRGNPLEVKTVLASVAFALAAYQLVLAAVGYGKLRPRFLGEGPAFRTHRASGDTIAVLLVIVGAMCLAVAGEDHGDDDAAFHAITGGLLLCVLAIVAIAIVVVTAKLGPNAGERDDGGGKGKSEQQRDR
jgi:uncharacterized membrane protein YidH (DUF202 family)